MEDRNQQSQSHVVLGQKYAFATASLIMGIASYVSFLGMEKAIVAIIFGWLALKSTPPPTLKDRRGWAKVGVGLGVALLIILPTILILNIDKLQALIEALEKLQDAQ